MKSKINFEKVLITGAGGMVGSYVDFGIKMNHRDLDITDFNETMRVVKEYQPEVIIHLAAETDVDRCDRDPNYAFLVNGVGTYNIATATNEIGAKLVYVSTAGIFDGEKTKPYKENDTPHPQNFYGMSKHAGELIVRGMVKNHIIARACWMFGGGEGKDLKFVGKIIRQLDKPEIKAVNDAYGSPTYGKDLISAIKRLLEEDAVGTFHLANEGSCSRYDVAECIIKTLQPKIKLTPVGLDYFPGANRVKNEAMSSKQKLMRPWKEALQEYLKTEWKIAPKK
jgi:dTDP-4-dehydrorhamnose reductase